MSTLGTYTPDNLYAGDYPMVREEVTILAGQNLARGAIIGKVTASGKYILCDTAATDGSEVPARVLLADTDASAADQVAIAAQTGEFNDNAIALGGSTVVADVKAVLADAGIFLKTPSN